MVQKIGTNGPDSIFGTEANDIFDGKGGNDVIYGGGGSDVIHGGNGNDYLEDDIVYLPDGTPILPITAGSDQLFGDSGDDLIYIWSGNDTADGGAGNDIIINDSSVATLLIGGTGNDAFVTGYGNGTAVLRPGPGNDTVDLNYYNYYFGSDTLIFERTGGGFGQDTVTGFNESAQPQSAGDQIQFQGYKPSDLVFVGASATGSGVDFVFKDGSILTLADVQPGATIDYVFV